MTAVEIIDAHLPLPSLQLGSRHDADRVRMLVAQWLVGYGSTNTRDAYRRNIDRWLNYCAISGLDPLAVETRRWHVDAWMRSLEVADEAASTRRQRLNAVSAFYRWCVNEEHVLRNPAAAVKRPYTDRDTTRTRGLSEQELVALLQAADTSTHPLARRDAFALRLMASNGLRVGALVSANVADLGYSQGARGMTYRSKGKRVKFTPFNRPTALACERYLEHAAEQAGVDVELWRARPAAGAPLFTMLRRPGERVTKRSIARAVTRLALEAFPEEFARRISPHWLRHTFTTLSLNNGVPLRDVQDALDHASPETTRLYDDDKDNIDRHPTHRLAVIVAERG